MTTKRDLVIDICFYWNYHYILNMQTNLKTKQLTMKYNRLCLPMKWAYDKTLVWSYDSSIKENCKEGTTSFLIFDHVVWMAYTYLSYADFTLTLLTYVCVSVLWFLKSGFNDFEIILDLRGDSSQRRSPNRDDALNNWAIRDAWAQESPRSSLPRCVCVCVWGCVCYWKTYCLHEQRQASSFHHHLSYFSQKNNNK